MSCEIVTSFTMGYFFVVHTNTQINAQCLKLFDDNVCCLLSYNRPFYHPIVGAVEDKINLCESIIIVVGLY